MCGIRSKIGLLSLAGLLLLSPVIYSADVMQGEKLYQITESELTALEQILTQQAQTISELSIVLDRQAWIIETLEGTLTQQQQTIETLSISFDAYEQEANRVRISRAIRNGGVGFAVGIMATIVIQSLLIK